MTANPFRTAVSDDVGAKSDGAGKVPSHAEGVVDDERDAGFVGDFGNGSHVRNIVFGVGDGFNVYGSCVFVDLVANVFWVVAVYPFDVDIKLLHVDSELVVGSAVQPARTDKVVTGRAAVGYGHELKWNCQR